MKKNKNKIGILGTGGIGGLLAILLSNNKNEIYCSNKKGDFGKFKLTLNSIHFGKKTKIINFTNKNFKNFDYIFICVKYYQLRSALKKIDSKTNKIIIPLLNGISHFELLKKKFKKKMIVSNIGKIISFKKNRIITHKSPNSPVIMMSSKNQKKINDVIEILKSSKIKTVINKNENAVIWTKFIRLSAISAITSLYNCNLGKIRKSKIKTFELDSLLKESIKLSKKIFKNNYSFRSIKKIISTLPDKLTTSLQRDINFNVNSELETQIGSIVKLSNIYKVSLPMYQKIYQKLKNK